MEGINQNLEKKEIPQLNNKTGLSSDYINEISPLISIYEWGGVEKVIEMFLTGRSFHIKKYKERYSGYKDIITDYNIEKIKELDILVDKMNEILKNSNSIDENEFRNNLNRIYFLVYGDNEKLL